MDIISVLCNIKITNKQTHTMQNATQLNTFDAAVFTYLNATPYTAEQLTFACTHDKMFSIECVYGLHFCAKVVGKGMQFVQLGKSDFFVAILGSRVFWEAVVTKNSDGTFTMYDVKFSVCNEIEKNVIAAQNTSAVAEVETPAETVIADVAVETAQGVTIVARKGYMLTQPAESKFFKLKSNDGTMLSECEGTQYDYCWLTETTAAAIVAQPADAALDTIREAFAEACADAQLTEEQTAEAEQSFYEPQLADEVRTEAETAALYDAAYAAAVEHIDWLCSQSESPADYALPYQ